MVEIYGDLTTRRLIRDLSFLLCLRFIFWFAISFVL